MGCNTKEVDSNKGQTQSKFLEAEAMPPKKKQKADENVAIKPAEEPKQNVDVDEQIDKDEDEQPTNKRQHRGAVLKKSKSKEKDEVVPYFLFLILIQDQNNQPQNDNAPVNYNNDNNQNNDIKVHVPDMPESIESLISALYYEQTLRKELKNVAAPADINLDLMDIGMMFNLYHIDTFKIT